MLALLPGRDETPVSVPAIEAETGLRRGRLDALLKTLRVDGAVDRVGTGWVATGRPWDYDADKYRRVVAARSMTPRLGRVGRLAWNQGRVRVRAFRMAITGFSSPG